MSNLEALVFLLSILAFCVRVTMSFEPTVFSASKLYTITAGLFVVTFGMSAASAALLVMLVSGGIADFEWMRFFVSDQFLGDIYGKNMHLFFFVGALIAWISFPFNYLHHRKTNQFFQKNPLKVC